MRRFPLEPFVVVALLAAAQGCVRREVTLGRRCPEGTDSCLEAEGGGVGPPTSGTVDAGAPDAPLEGASCAAGCDAGSDAAPPSTSRCVPGHYVGSFDIPDYRPVAAGLCGLVTIYGGSGSGRWEFVVPSDAASDGRSLQLQTCLEFALTSSADAGTGDAAAADAPSELRTELSATLDCETGVLSGELRGAYYSQGLCTLGEEAWYSVKGFIDAQYDPGQQAFVQGYVDLREPASLLPADQQLNPPTGGVGTWEARRAEGMGDVPPTAGCLDDVQYTDFEVQR